MKLIAIETSCDDTCVSIYEVAGSATSASFKVLANNANSQIDVHRPYGGVYPVLAKREHAKNLPILLEASLKQSKAKKFDAIAVTSGPGLEMCLWEGITFAKDLAKKYGVPLIPVNHMEGHALSVFGKNKGKFKIPKVKMPMLALLVSGGHTQLVLVEKWLKYKIIGETLDDAVGEAFDKVARMLGLPYPGGPEISHLAEKVRASQIQENSEIAEHSREGGRLKDNASQIQENFAALPSLRGLRHGQNFPASAPLISLPRPMLHTKDFNFSFSGLKTAVLYLVRDLGGTDKLTPEMKAQIACEFENAAIECLVVKTAKAIEKDKIKTLAIGGGVSSNKFLRSEMEKLAKTKGVELLLPPPGLSTDNSLMIGIAGYLNFMKNKQRVPTPTRIKASGNLRL